MKIAISGKGGAGKSTVAANLLYCCKARHLPTFAIDADPDANRADPGLTRKIGFTAAIKTAGGYRRETCRRRG